MSEETHDHEILRGHLDECTRHLSNNLAAKIPRGNRGRGRFLKPLAAFCGAAENTVDSWLQGRLPHGNYRIRLMCFLHLIGYRVLELERMPPAHRRFAELIGLNLLTIKQAIELLGYHDPAALYAGLRGEEGISTAKEQVMWDAWKGRRGELEQKQIMAARRLKKIFDFTSSQTVSIPRGPMSTSRQSAIVGVAGGLLALLEEKPLDQLVNGELTSLRPAEGLLMRLSANLTALCSKLVATKASQGGTDG